MSRLAGFHHSEETKEKIRLANTGYVPSIEQRMKQSLTRSKNPVWCNSL
jgi:hypothetical protein